MSKKLFKSFSSLRDKYIFCMRHERQERKSGKGKLCSAIRADLPSPMNCVFHSYKENVTVHTLYYFSRFSFV